MKSLAIHINTIEQYVLAMVSILSIFCISEILLCFFYHSRCRKGFRYIGNKTCAVDKCYEENRDGKLCGDLDCVVTNDTNEAMCK